MTPRKHRIAAAIFGAMFAFAILGIVVQGTRVDWDWNAVTSFGRRGGAPFWYAAVATSLFATVMAIAAVWQLRLSRR